MKLGLTPSLRRTPPINILQLSAYSPVISSVTAHVDRAAFMIASVGWQINYVISTVNIESSTMNSTMRCKLLRDNMVLLESRNSPRGISEPEEIVE